MVEVFEASLHSMLTMYIVLYCISMYGCSLLVSIAPPLVQNTFYNMVEWTFCVVIYNVPQSF